MRLVYPTVTNNGLGNNVPALAKAHLIAETCRMTYQPPVWPPCEHVKPATPNGYGYYFATTPVDALKVRLLDYQFRLQRKLSLRLWPTLSFGRQEYGQAGVVDIGEACLGYLRQRGLDDPARSVVVTTSGMWGGYAAIARARAWLNELFLSHAETRRRLLEIEQRAAGRLRVAVNIRLGDFAARAESGTIRGGERVVRLPLDWYARICRQIREHCDCEFILVTNGKREELAEFLAEFRPIEIIGEPYQDLLGVLLLSRSDLVVCSNSTYSRMGCFLNDRPYLWPADTLYQDASGRYGYLWKDGGHPVRNGRGADLEAVRRCFALRIDFGALPRGVLRYLESGGRLPIEIADDIMYRDPAPLL